MITDKFKLITPRAMDLLVNIENGTTTYKLSRKVDMTHSHTSKLINFFKKEKIITNKKEGRERPIKLSKKGLDLQKAIRLIIHLIK